jgi:hypothetical protein
MPGTVKRNRPLSSTNRVPLLSKWSRKTDSARRLIETSGDGPTAGRFPGAQQRCQGGEVLPLAWGGLGPSRGVRPLVEVPVRAGQGTRQGGQADDCLADTYLSALFWRLAGRLGKRRAAVAVATLAVTIGVQREIVRWRAARLTPRVAVNPLEEPHYFGPARRAHNVGNRLTAVPEGRTRYGSGNQNTPAAVVRRSHTNRDRGARTSPPSAAGPESNGW